MQWQGGNLLSTLVFPLAWSSGPAGQSVVLLFLPCPRPPKLNSGLWAGEGGGGEEEEGKRGEEEERRRGGAEEEGGGLQNKIRDPD